MFFTLKCWSNTSRTPGQKQSTPSLSCTSYILICELYHRAINKSSNPQSPNWSDITPFLMFNHTLLTSYLNIHEQQPSGTLKINLNYCLIEHTLSICKCNKTATTSGPLAHHVTTSSHAPFPRWAILTDGPLKTKAKFICNRTNHNRLKSTIYRSTPIQATSKNLRKNSSRT